MSLLQFYLNGSTNPYYAVVPLGLCALGLLSYKVFTGLMKKGDQEVAKENTKRFGRGAVGFETGSRKVGIPPEIALRIRLGEEVSGEEITEALEKIRQDELAAEREIIEAEERRIEAEKKKAAKQNPIRRRQK